MKKLFNITIVCLIAVVGVFAMASCEKTQGEVIEVVDMITILTELSSGTADVGVMDSVMARHYMKQDSRFANELMIVPNLVLAEEEYGIGMRKNAALTLNKINLALYELDQEGEVAKIAEKYGLEDTLLPIEIAYDEELLIEEGNRTEFYDLKAKNKIIIGYTLFEPICYKDENGTLTGFDVDLARKVGEKLGITMEFQEIIWDSMILDLADKKVDLIWNGMTITSDRRAQMNISNAYMKNEQVAIIRKSDINKYYDRATIKKARIAVENESAGEKIVRGTLLSEK